VGDQLLKAAARRLESVVRSGDLVARLGGDEFVIVMRDLADSSEALRVALRIVDEFRLAVTAAGHELHITASVGVAIAVDSDDGEALLREADIAMYRAKEGGRDRTSLYNDDLRTAANARVTLEAELRPALDLGALAVHYQPEIDLATGRVCAVEALLRWHHPSGELYAADRFIDVAEEIGMIVDSGNWVVSEACAQAAAWMRSGDHAGLTMRLNLSRQQLAESTLMVAFDEAIERSGLDPSLLCVEIAEAALILPSATAAQNLSQLRARGVRLAIDNFGTGYAALGYLRERPVDMVKIDRSFIRDIGTSDYSRRLVAGITALAHQMGLAVSAEGVETVEQAAFLRDLGCTSAQGFLYSPAVPGTEMGVLLDRVYPTH
jgi:predicted signal transduction protein with EAL and GGDEF domain